METFRFRIFSICFSLSTSASKFLFLIFCRDIPCCKLPFLYGKGENLARQSSYKYSVIINLEKSVSNRFLFVFLLEDTISEVYFLLTLYSTNHHKVHFVLVMYQKGNPFALVETGIYHKYAQAGSRFSILCQFLFSAMVKFLFSQCN